MPNEPTPQSEPTPSDAATSSEATPPPPGPGVAQPPASEGAAPSASETGAPPVDPTAAPAATGAPATDPTAAIPLPPPSESASAEPPTTPFPTSGASAQAPTTPPADGAPAWPSPVAPPPSSGAPVGPPPVGGAPAGPPPIVPPLNPWQAPGAPATGPFPTSYQGPVPPGGFPPPAPGMGWPQPPKKGGISAGLIAAIAVFAVVLIGCIGAVGVSVLRSNDSSNSADPAYQPTFPQFPTDEPTVPGLDDDSSGAPAGPQASPDGVKDINDLDNVCDQQMYFPKSPKYQGKAPHPIAIMLKDRKDMDSRIPASVYDVGYSSAKSRTDAWNVYFHPTKVQLTACVDLVSSGAKVRTCKFDDPKPDSLPLKVGTYQLTLFETATRKQLLTKKMTGDDRSCPTVVLLGSDRTIYTSISDRAYVAALKKFVEK
jgi:hypothetical protein